MTLKSQYLERAGRIIDAKNELRVIFSVSCNFFCVVRTVLGLNRGCLSAASVIARISGEGNKAKGSTHVPN